MHLETVLAANVQRIRQGRHLTPKALASRARISVALVREIEQAQADPRLLTLLALARALDVPPHVLLQEVTVVALPPS